MSSPLFFSTFKKSTYDVKEDQFSDVMSFGNIKDHDDDFEPQMISLKEINNKVLDKVVKM